MKLLSHLMKLFHLMTLQSQQFCLCGTLFNVHATLVKHALRLALASHRSPKDMHLSLSSLHVVHVLLHLFYLILFACC